MAWFVVYINHGQISYKLQFTYTLVHFKLIDWPWLVVQGPKFIEKWACFMISSSYYNSIMSFTTLNPTFYYLIIWPTLLFNHELRVSWQKFVYSVIFMKTSSCNSTSLINVNPHFFGSNFATSYLKFKMELQSGNFRKSKQN